MHWWFWSVWHFDLKKKNRCQEKCLSKKCNASDLTIQTAYSVLYINIWKLIFLNQVSKFSWIYPMHIFTCFVSLENSILVLPHAVCIEVIWCGGKEQFRNLILVLITPASAITWDLCSFKICKLYCVTEVIKYQVI